MEYLTEPLDPAKKYIFLLSYKEVAHPHDMCKYTKYLESLIIIIINKARNLEDPGVDGRILN